MTLTNKLLLCGLLIGVAAYSTHTRAEESAQVVKITASKFHFTPDHITLVKGQPVTLQLTRVIVKCCGSSEHDQAASRRALSLG
jgi:cupredoxin-like protein